MSLENLKNSYVMPLFLIGYMGSGKSTLGRKAASALGWRFVDMDKEIERRAGMSVSEIFSTLGEPAFRQMERDYIASLSPEENVVVATGGGAPCHFDNMDVMNSLGVTLYLRVPAGALVERLIASHTRRPLIEGKSPEQLRLYIESHLAEREPYYTRATYTLEGVGINARHIVETLRLRV